MPLSFLCDRDVSELGGGLRAERASGAARRRRDRRRRALLKHERMSFAMQNATVHHSRHTSDRKVDTAVQVNSVTDMTSSSTQTCVFFDLGVDARVTYTTPAPVDVTPVSDVPPPPVHSRDTSTCD